MFNKKVIFTILLFIIAIGAVSCVSAMDIDENVIVDDYDDWDDDEDDEDDWDDDWDDDEDDYGLINREDDFYDFDNVDYDFEDEPINATLQVSQSGEFYKNKFLTVKLIGDEDYDFGGIELFVKFSNGKTEYLYTDEYGEASYKIPFDAGSYSATVEISDYHEGEFNCAPVTLKDITISKASATLEPVRLSVPYSSASFFEVKVADTNTRKVLSGVKVTLKIFTGKKYKTVTVKTSGNGIARYDVSKLTAGNHNVEVSVADTNVNAQTQKSSIKISKAKLKISAQKTCKKGKFRITLKNKVSDKAVKGVKVTVKVYTGKSYKTFTVKTDGKGQAGISAKSLSKGKHKVVISTKSTGNYKACSIRSSVIR